MDLRTLLLTLTKTAIKQIQDFDHGLAITNNGYHLSYGFHLDGIQIILDSPKYDQKSGFKIFCDHDGNITDGWLVIDEKKAFLTPTYDFTLQQLYQKQPKKIEETIIEYTREVCKLKTDEKRLSGLKLKILETNQ